jgi:hypothetical protein
MKNYSRKKQEILLSCLQKLTSPQYSELLNALLSPKEQDQLTDKDNKAESLNDLEKWEMLDKVESILREKWFGILEKELNQDAKGNQPVSPQKTLRNNGTNPATYIKEIPFTNRENEINQLTSEFAPAYYLVDAPTGYGKTALLEVLEKRLKIENWVCARVSFQENDKVGNIANAFAKSFGLKLPQDQNQDYYLQGSLLGNALYKKFKPQIQQNTFGKGVILLIDLDKKPSMPFVQELLQVIADVRGYLKRLNYFEYGQNKFRVVLTGRNIAAQSEIRNSEFPFSVLRLSPFSYSVIQEAVRNYHSKAESEWSIKDLSAHLFYMTGGHPGCIIKILNRKDLQVLSGRLPYEQDEQIWKEVVKRKFLDISDGLYKDSIELKNFSTDFGILRILDYFILRHMLMPLKDKIQKDEYQLADLLTSTYLLDWKGRVLQDDIARRLLAIGLRHEDKDYSKRCKNARDICANRLAQHNTQMPERWFIEYLFQSLQLHGKEIFDRDQRRKIREDFFNIDLIVAWKILVDNHLTKPCEAIAEKSAFDQSFEDDWEFRFTINYYLREDKYVDSGDHPYNQLRNKIDDFFKAMP